MFLQPFFDTSSTESIIRFPQVKPLAGLDWTSMESWWLTPFRTEIFCNPDFVIIIGSDFGFVIMIRQLARVVTRCAAFEMVSNEHEVCNYKNENKIGLPSPSS